MRIYGRIWPRPAARETQKGHPEAPKSHKKQQKLVKNDGSAQSCLKTSGFMRFGCKIRCQTKVFAQKAASAPKARPRAPKSRPRRPRSRPSAARKSRKKRRHGQTYWSKGLSKPLDARSTKPHRLSGRFGGAAPLDPATEPLRLNKGPWSEARERDRSKQVR